VWLQIAGRVRGDRTRFAQWRSVKQQSRNHQLTFRGTHSEAASYEFTTLTTVPGTLTHNGARIQVLDLPGIIQGAKDGKGRGRQVIAVARTCNLIFIVLDVLKPLADLAILENELEGFGIRLKCVASKITVEEADVVSKEPPKITIKRKETGGVSVISILVSAAFKSVQRTSGSLSCQRGLADPYTAALNRLATAADIEMTGHECLCESAR
jgi:small GTP-binding protein